jgi:hypothetical protein
MLEGSELLAVYGTHYNLREIQWTKCKVVIYRTFAMLNLMYGGLLAVGWLAMPDIESEVQIPVTLLLDNSSLSYPRNVCANNSGNELLAWLKNAFDVLSYA